MVASSSGCTPGSWRRVVRQVAVARGRADQVLQHHRPGDRPLRRAHGDQARQVHLADVRRQALQPLAVGDGDLRAGILDAVHEVGTQAPGVQRRHHRPDRLPGPERQRPFGQVAHGDDDPVALRHAIPLGQHAAQGAGGAEVGVVGLALALVDDELAGSPAAAQVEDLAQAAAGVLVDPCGPAPDDLVLHLEGHAPAP
jgi:hypothetical protein